MPLYSDTVVCQCGCGLPAPIATRSSKQFGYEKGQVHRFRAGHNSRLRAAKSYRKVSRPDHPRATATRTNIHAHVDIAERALGHCLPVTAQVHHVDGNRHNNANYNLVICQDNAYHALLHIRAKTLRAGGNPNTDRACTKCGVAKPFAEFSKRGDDTSHGLNSTCRQCDAETAKAANARRKAIRARLSRLADAIEQAEGR